MLNIKFPEKPYEGMTWRISHAMEIGKFSEDSLFVVLVDELGKTEWQTLVSFPRPYFNYPNDDELIQEIEGQVSTTWAEKVRRDSLESRLFGEY